MGIVHYYIPTKKSFIQCCLTLMQNTDGLLCCGGRGQQLVGIVAQRDQISPADPAEAGTVCTLQSTATIPRLPLIVPRGLKQFQSSAFLERWMPSG